MSAGLPWWKGAIIYQIYPRSFMDSNGDGLGDIRGITEKLDYISDLGVDGIWISPIFTSPMKDFGYDVADYRNIDPMFGTLDDFRELLTKAHDFGLKVLIDQVLSHSSDQHPWFKESRRSRDNAKADWFVWAAPNEGKAPNNWLSIFGGSAWEWEPSRQQYYLHNFLASQPDLNFHNPAVRQAHLDNMRFWLELGVDGFRFDVVNMFFHHQSLQDNPLIAAKNSSNPGVPEKNPYAMQRHQFDISQPENLSFLRQIRELLDEFGDTTSVGEIFDDKPLELMAEYTTDDRLHMAYSFDFLQENNSVDYIRNVIERTESIIGGGWPCWAFSNHDVPRVTSRWNEGVASKEFALAAFALLLSLRGTVCIYQGEELGLPEANLQFDELQDPYGIAMWPDIKGRDGCRTPMPWNNAMPNAGFTPTKPWLMIDQDHLPLAVSEQQEKSSTLQKLKIFIRWRNKQPALSDGSISIFKGSGQCMGLVRENHHQKLLVLVNLTMEKQKVDLSELEETHLLTDSGFNGTINANEAILPPYQALFAELD